MRIIKDLPPFKARGNGWTLSIMAVIAFALVMVFAHYVITPFMNSLGF